MSAEVQQKAKEVIDVSAEAGLLSGKSPTGFAAAAIYATSLLCNDKVTQRRVADATNVTEVTARTQYQEQLEAMENTVLARGSLVVVLVVTVLVVIALAGGV